MVHREAPLLSPSPAERSSKVHAAIQPSSPPPNRALTPSSLQTTISPSLPEVLPLLLPSPSHTPTGNCVPISASLPADILTPVIAYLRLTNGGRSGESFLLESVVRGETAGRWSFVGASEFGCNGMGRELMSLGGG